MLNETGQKAPEFMKQQASLHGIRLNNSGKNTRRFGGSDARGGHVYSSKVRAMKNPNKATIPSTTAEMDSPPFPMRDPYCQGQCSYWEEWRRLPWEGWHDSQLVGNVNVWQEGW